MSSAPEPNRPPEPMASKPPDVALDPVPTETVASTFLTEELQKARVALQRTRWIGLLVLGLVGAEMLYITIHFTSELRPHAAAEIAEGFIAQQVQDKGPDLANQLKQKVPEYIEQTPDYVLRQLPSYRQSVEERVEAELRHYSQTTSQQLGQRLDGYLEAHKEEIKGMLAAGNDPQAVQQLGPSLKQELLAYIQEKPASGESIQAQIQQSLSALEEIQKKTHRLATARDLTPQEKQTRRAIAVLGKAIEQQRKRFPPNPITEGDRRGGPAPSF